MKAATRLEYSLIVVFALASVWPSRALAQDHDTHTMSSQHQPQTAEQKKQANALVRIVREATERFRNVSAAENEGYGLRSAASAAGTTGRWDSTT